MTGESAGLEHHELDMPLGAHRRVRSSLTPQCDQDQIGLREIHLLAERAEALAGAVIRDGVTYRTDVPVRGLEAGHRVSLSPGRSLIVPPGLASNGNYIGEPRAAGIPRLEHELDNGRGRNRRRPSPAKSSPPFRWFSDNDGEVLAGSRRYRRESRRSDDQKRTVESASHS